MKHSFLTRLAACLLLGVLLSALCFSLSSCGIQPGKRETTVFIATDIHLFANTLVGEDNKVYLKDRFASDGRVQEYDYGLVDALVKQVNTEKPEFLVLTGDLSFNGERESHLELARLLSGVGEHTKVLVIPGNHDIYSLGAVSVLGDEVSETENITAEDFREIYSDFGYEGGLYYDKDTLSYIYELSEDKWALMLDTTLSRYNEENEYNLVGGSIEDSTFLWLEEKLAYAKENGISVISFTHHNLLVHNEQFEFNYTIRNKDRLCALYAKYGVELNFSGHLHIQSIRNTQTDGSTVYDVSGVSLLDYGNRYGRLDIYDNCYSYQSHQLDMSDIAEDAREHSFNVFCDKYYAKAKLNYSGLGEDKCEQVTRLLSKINAYYFDGSYEKIRELIFWNGSLIKLIEDNTYNYEKSYIKSILDVPNENQHKLIIER